MRLLSFLSDIENALVAESPAVDGGSWETARMVNFHSHLARLTLTARVAAEVRITGGAICLQSFALADGSQCVKATLNWRDSQAQPVIPIYGVPSVNWKQAAARIASAFLEGPAAPSVTRPQDVNLSPLAAELAS